MVTTAGEKRLLRKKKRKKEKNRNTKYLSENHLSATSVLCHKLRNGLSSVDERNVFDRSCLVMIISPLYHVTPIDFK